MKGDRNDLPSIAGTFGGGSPFYRVPFSYLLTTVFLLIIRLYLLDVILM